MEPLKSNSWSAETLLRGVRTVSEQPQQRLSLDPYDDPDLMKEFQAPCSWWF